MTTEERMERIVDHIADRREQLDAVLATLAEAQIKTEEQIQVTQLQIARVARESEARDRAIDKRIDRLAKEAAERDKRLDRLARARRSQDVAHFVRDKPVNIDQDAIAN